MTNIIATDEALKMVCERAEERAYVMLDTEFVRTRTLYPMLGLIQLNDTIDVSLIDPLAIENLEPLKRLLTNKRCLKVLHACSEDLEAFYTNLGVVPSPVFDTQFAAQLCGVGTTMGYANLVETLLDIQLDKGESRTDWLARPLSDSQLRYAANDVIYLQKVYEHLTTQLSSEQSAIVIDEAASLSTKKIAQMPSEFAYLGIKNNWKLRGQSLLALKYLAAWRLERARNKNLALNFVLKESTMFRIALAMPSSKTALSKLGAMSPQEYRVAGDAVIRQICKALADGDTHPSCIPASVKRLSEVKHYKPALAKIKEVSAQIAAETGIAVEILCSKKQAHQLLKYYWFDTDEYQVQGLKPDLLVGWRAPLYAKYLEKLDIAKL